MNKYSFILLIQLIQTLWASHLYGTDTTIMEKPIIGPGSRTVEINFKVKFPPNVVPYVLIAFSKYHFSMAPINHYRASVINPSNTGFSILYETETVNMVFGAEIEWMAFDNNSDFFGEVQYIEEFNTEGLAEFYKTGDEHRMQLKKINFQRTYLRTPGVAIFVLGAFNDGIERLVSANYTDATPFSFTLQALAWHHTELSYYKFAIIDECLSKTGREYVWNEEDHQFKPHPWNQIHLYEDKEFRHKQYNIPIKHEYSKNFKPDFIFSAFVGYDIKNYKPNKAEFNLGLQNVEIARNYKSVKMDVGTWHKTQVAGAQWNYIVCETNGDFISQRKLSLLQKILYAIFSILGLFAIVYAFKKIKNSFNHKIKVKEL